MMTMLFGSNKKDKICASVCFSAAAEINLPKKDTHKLQLAPISPRLETGNWKARRGILNYNVDKTPVDAGFFSEY